jgi:hypothetical protein
MDETVKLSNKLFSIKFDIISNIPARPKKCCGKKVIFTPRNKVQK